MGNVEIPKWLKRLPLAPEFHPTDTEFADPIAYISKIEKEASAFGICKIIPPLPKPSKKYVLSNLNKSLKKRPELGSEVNLVNVGSRNGGNDGDSRAVFTTRQQELGQENVKRTKDGGSSMQLGAHKQVWQSGEVYTLEQFESKAKAFARSTLGMIKEVSPLVVEAMFWQAATEKPIYVEYANDVPGSGFGEHDSSLRYFHRRRKKRAFYQRRTEKSYGKSEIKSVNFQCNEVKDVSAMNDTSSFLETTTSSPMSTTKSIDETSKVSSRKVVNSSSELEGTAGWKLSNSPWNLQVIARAPGSLTRFMPDDIPGVTSPMVYIGMLFSWFAWHVEDHELHSMNFLHLGSPKTWYAVPGEYAYSFEEMIRTEAYGGKNDFLDALTLLGEKTTLLSPEVVVASNIPCCRLVQNPGEFVVTFPRAYHAGFSHGFNCGEAANFGTPQWLEVAKDAAVRRAAMNHLPMLSHQQLLYLLTVSFVSRVPRSLLLGARSSRLRDRQKEKRELLVKKAFIEDIVHENQILSLLGKEYRAVLWDTDLLTSPCKEPQLPTIISGSDMESGDSKNPNDLLKEMSFYMENLNDQNWDNDDLSGDFQVDSGTLMCVACGILGFPLMSVVQPSERSAMELHVEGGSGVSEPKNSPSSSDIVHHSVSEYLSPAGCLLSPENDHPEYSTKNFGREWNTSNKFLRPRIFCLEHAVQILDLLGSKGGANVLILCHSDYRKIKAHAIAVAEETGSPFKYNEIPLDNASRYDLNLIDNAIDGEGHDECGEDWTSKLRINLRYCINVRKNSSPKQIQHALLGGLFCDKNPCPDFSNIKWKSRRFRSNIKLNAPVNSKSRESNRTEKDKIVEAKIDDVIGRKEEKILQYSRRKSKRKHAPIEVEAANQNNGNNFTSVGMLEMQHEVPVLEATKEMVLTSVPVDVVNSLGNATQVVGSIKVQVENHILEVKKREIEHCQSDKLYELRVTEERNEKNKDTVCILVTETDESVEVHSEEQVTKDINTTQVGHNLVTLDEYRRCGDDNDRDVSTTELMVDVDSTMNGIVGEKSCMNNEAGNCVILNEEKTEGAGYMDMNVDTEPILHTVGVINEHVSAVKESFEVPQDTCATEEFEIGTPSHKFGQQDVETESGLDQVEPWSPLSMHESFKAPGEPLIPAEWSKGAANCSTVKGNTMETSVSSNFTLINQSCPASVEEEVSRLTSLKEDLSCGEVQQQIHTISGGNEKECGVHRAKRDAEVLGNDTESCSPRDVREPENLEPNVEFQPKTGKGRKRKQDVEMETENKFDPNVFIRSPCEGLRQRISKNTVSRCGNDDSETVYQMPMTKTVKKPSETSHSEKGKKEKAKGQHKCDLEGCRMTFKKKSELELHKNNRCPHQGCRKRFSSHKYAILHQRVHDDERPLKCSWKGCSMSFKWAWARTEHLRVHTGERPYTCKVDGCGLSFRFVSDFSRHRRKTGHYVNSPPA